MAFPTTAVLDNFNTGASQALTARAGWNASALTGTTWQTDSTPTTAVGTSVGGNAWGSSSADSECYAVVTSFNAAINTLHICARIKAIGASPTYYGVAWATSAATDFRICKRVAGVTTLLGTNTPTTFTAGDSFGISVQGTTIKSWYRSGAGAWVQKDSITDSSITGSGFLGGIVKTVGSAVPAITDFGGGVLTSGTVFNQSISGSAQFSGIRPKLGVQRKVPGVLTFAGAEVAHPTARSVTASFTPSGSLSRQLSLVRTLTSALSFSGARSAATAYARTLAAASFTPVGSQSRVKAVSKALTGSLSFVGAQTRVATKALTASLTPAGALTMTLSLFRTLTAVFAPVGALKRSTNRKLTAAGQFVGMVITSIGGSHLFATFHPTAPQVTHGLPARTLFAGFQATSQIARFTTRQLVSSLIASGVMHTQYLPPAPPPFPGGGGFGALMDDAFFQRYQVDGKWRGVKRVRA